MIICLISPGYLSTNPRLVKEARALTEAGHEVHIVCGSFGGWWLDADSQFRNEFQHITYVPFGPSAGTASYLKQTVRRRLATALVRAGLKTVSLSVAAQHPASKELAEAACSIYADLYIAHYVAALPAAAYAAQVHRTKYAFDAEDFHSGELPATQANSTEQEMIKSIECRYIPGAVFTSASAPLIADAYASTYGIRRPTVILNVFPSSAGPPSATPCGIVEPRPSIYWFSQTIGPGRGLEQLLRAIAQAKSRPHIYIRGRFSAGYEFVFFALVDELRLRDRVHILPLLSPNKMEYDGARFDIGYVGESAQTRSRDMALTNKLFSYLVSGLPFVLSDNQSHRALMPTLGRAVRLFCIDDVSSLSGAIDEFLLDTVSLRDARQHAWNLGRTIYNWDQEKSKLLSLVDSVTFGRRVI